MRSRNLKPGFFKNELLIEIEPLGRILFTGLWCLADREGRLEDRPQRIKFEILPGDQCDIEVLLSALQVKGFILRYAVNEYKYIQILNFLKHQNPHHMEAPSEITPPPGKKNKFNQKPITKKQRERIFNRDENKCVLCGTIEKLTIDHIRPIWEGGTSNDNNLRILCKTCNSKKGKKTLISNRDRVDIGSRLSRPSPPITPLIPDSFILIPDSFISIFENFWNLYPTRDGKRVGKKECLEFFKKNISEADIPSLLVATQYYAQSKTVKDGYSKHPIRFLKKEFWKDWIEPPEQEIPSYLRGCKEFLDHAEQESTEEDRNSPGESN